MILALPPAALIAGAVVLIALIVLAIARAIDAELAEDITFLDRTHELQDRYALQPPCAHEPAAQLEQRRRRRELRRQAQLQRADDELVPRIPLDRLR